MASDDFESCNTPQSLIECVKDDVAIGGVCDSTGDCHRSAYCSQKKCVADKHAGASCAEANECTSGSCSSGVCVAACGDT